MIILPAIEFSPLIFWPPDLDGVALYKHLPSQYAEKWLNDGEVLIGTYSGMRRLENSGDGRLDEDDGSLTVSIDDYLSTRDGSLQDYTPNGFIPAVTCPPGLEGSGVGGLNTKHQVTDSFLLCLSENPSDELTRAFKSDACLEVTDHEMLFTAIGREIDKRHRLERNGPEVGKCVYGPRINNYRSAGSLSPWLVKDAKYNWQAEWRARWRLQGGDGTEPFEINPFVVASPEIANSVRRIR